MTKSSLAPPRLKVGAWLRRWRSSYHCKACGVYFPRRMPICPTCKTRKGGRGQPIPSGAPFMG